MLTLAWHFFMWGFPKVKRFVAVGGQSKLFFFECSYTGSQVVINTRKEGCKQDVGFCSCSYVTHNPKGPSNYPNGKALGYIKPQYQGTWALRA